MRMRRRDIIDLALQRIGNNTESIRRQARVKLNRILQDLYLQWDWPFLWTTVPVTLPTNAAFSLPDDFVKPEDDQALVLNTTLGAQYLIPLQELDHLAFAQIARPGTEATLPRIWTIDYGQRLGIAWPRPADTCGLTLRYKRLPPDMPTSPPAPASATQLYDDDIPTFPWDAYLSDALVQWGMEYEADPRANDQLMKNKEQLGLIRGATWPERSFRSTIPLDPTVFSTPWRGE